MKRIFLLLALVACSDITGLGAATSFQPSAIYRQWWTEMEACSGLSGDVDKVRWFSAPYLAKNGREVGGIWLEDGNRIFIEERFLNNWPTIKHEMLHALLQRGDHPVQYFNGPCGSLLY